MPLTAPPNTLLPMLSPAAPSAWEPYRARLAVYADIRVSYDYAS